MEERKRMAGSGGTSRFMRGRKDNVSHEGMAHETIDRGICFPALICLLQNTSCDKGKHCLAYRMRLDSSSQEWEFSWSIGNVDQFQ